MSIEQIGYGAGGGLLTGLLSTIFVALGMKERIKSLEEKKLEKEVFDQFQHTFDIKSNEIGIKIDRLDVKLDKLLQK